MNRPAYQLGNPLLTPAEQSFYGVLANMVVKDKAIIFSKVRIADIVQSIQYEKTQEPDDYFWRIAYKHFDFVICSKDDFSVICVIELNDKSHENEDRKYRDWLVREVCNQSKIPFLAARCKDAYKLTSIKTILNFARNQTRKPYTVSRTYPMNLKNLEQIEMF